MKISELRERIRNGAHIRTLDHQEFFLMDNQYIRIPRRQVAAMEDCLTRVVTPNNVTRYYHPNDPVLPAPENDDDLHNAEIYRAAKPFPEN